MDSRGRHQVLFRPNLTRLASDSRPHGPSYSPKVVESRVYGKTRSPRNDGWDPTRGNYFPALSNCALDGLEQLLREKFPTKKPLPSLGGKLPAVNLVRYADDFVITGRTKELLEGEIKPLVEQFLQERGLKLLPRRRSSHTWRKVLISSDKTCASI